MKVTLFSRFRHSVSLRNQLLICKACEVQNHDDEDEGAGCVSGHRQYSWSKGIAFLMLYFIHFKTPHHNEHFQSFPKDKQFVCEVGQPRRQSCCLAEEISRHYVIFEENKMILKYPNKLGVSLVRATEWEADLSVGGGVFA